MPSKTKNCQYAISDTCQSCSNSANPLLAGLKKDDLNPLDEGRTKLEFEAGELIFREGMQPSGLMCLSQGKVMVTQKDEFDNKIVTHLHKGVSFLGIADFFSDLPYQNEAVALNNCIVCMINRDKVHELMSVNTFFMKRVMGEISNQLRESHQRLLSLTKKQMRARLAGALIELYSIYGLKEDQSTLDIYLKRKDLATLSNMNVANVIRHLSTFQKEGLVAIDQKALKILDLETLYMVAKIKQPLT